MQFAPPECYNCPFFKSDPQFIGDSGKCTKYPRSIPKGIFYEAGRCTKRNEKEAVKEVKKR